MTDLEFRAYFEKFGKLQDAYMPRDHSRQMYRGIGFVTFASPESVEKVMACKHWCVHPESATSSSVFASASTRMQQQQLICLLTLSDFCLYGFKSVLL